MSEVKESANSVLDTLESMLETHRDLMIVKFLQRFSNSSAIAVIGIFSLMILVLILIFAGVGFSWWIGEELNNMKAGFFIVCGIYSVVLFLILLFSKKLLLPILRDLIIDKIYEDD